MELYEIKEVVAEILSDIEKNKISCTYRLYSTFLVRVGMESRRNPDILKKFDYQFRKNSITLWCGKQEIHSIWDFNKDDTVTFRPVENSSRQTLAPSRAPDAPQKISFKHAGRIDIVNEESGITLYKHQEDSVQQLQEKIVKSSKTPFAGLLVLPTGGGKTLTAAYWLAKNYLDKNKKILWIAHRHELLEQAKTTFQEQLAFKDILPNRTSFNYRIISGIHDRPVNIKATDDIIFSSKDSLNSGFEHLLKNWINGQTDEVFLVIDEAHHATAKTYRRLINQLRGSVNSFRMLGLTATPFRTAENENGLLRKVFPDDIVYKIDLRTLINRGILSEPVFEEEDTEFDMSTVLSEKQIDNLKYFDIDSIGRDTAKTIAENDKRNWIIVNKYSKNKQKYGQTLVFALNQDNAIALKKLFEQIGVKAEYVLSSIRDQATGVTISSKENKEKIDRFRKGELEVLINVNILTEGTDLPRVQSVFLARPTISPILMTQMIGRGLRGEKAGGTKSAYIVSFIDNWQDKVTWINPEKLIIKENIDFDDKETDTKKRLIRLVAINKIEEFAILTNKIIDQVSKDELEKLDFIERLPLGFFSFSTMSRIQDEEREKNCEVLVYDNVRQSYVDFINGLPDFFKKNKIENKDNLLDTELDSLCNKVEVSFFHGCLKYPAYYSQDIKDILQYYAQNEAEPCYVELKDREHYDIGTVANEILKSGFSISEAEAFKTKTWESSAVEWKAFFGYDEKYFLNELDLAIRKILKPHLYKRSAVVPTDNKELREVEKLSMAELREVLPIYWKHLSDTIYKAHTDQDGFFMSATGNYKSKNKLDFQIDHIKPIKEGGLTVLKNLQLLTRNENAQKGASVESEFDKVPSTQAKKSNAKYRLLTPSKALAAVIGDAPITSPEIVEKIWAYVQKNDLQDKKNKKMVHADEKLKNIFEGRDKVNIFEITKYVLKHCA